MSSKGKDKEIMKRHEIMKEMDAYKAPKVTIKFEAGAPGDIVNNYPFYLKVVVLEVTTDSYGYWTLYEVSERE